MDLKEFTHEEKIFFLAKKINKWEKLIYSDTFYETYDNARAAYFELLKTETIIEDIKSKVIQYRDNTGDASPIYLNFEGYGMNKKVLNSNKLDDLLFEIEVETYSMLSIFKPLNIQYNKLLESVEIKPALNGEINNQNQTPLLFRQDHLIINFPNKYVFQSFNYNSQKNEIESYGEDRKIWYKTNIDENHNFNSTTPILINPGEINDINLIFDIASTKYVELFKKINPNFNYDVQLDYKIMFEESIINN
jgi:hypothetical protein